MFLVRSSRRILSGALFAALLTALDGGPGDDICVEGKVYVDCEL